LTGKLFFVNYGADTINPKNTKGSNIYGTNDFGGDISKTYDTIANNNIHHYNNKIGQGISTTMIMLSFTATYQVAHNMFIDASLTLRKVDSAYHPYNANSSVASIAFRWNIPKRLFEF